MTEAEWQDCADPTVMLAFVRGKASDRKVWLFACGSYRRLLRIRAGEREWSAVEVVERFAEGLASQEDLGALDDDWDIRWYRADPWNATFRVLYEVHDREGEHAVAELANLVRELFSNPFRPVVVDPGWLTWNGGTIRRLAQETYEGRSPGEGILDAARLAVLADALEDAGCSDPEILSHLRGPGVHVRGCWAVDLLIAKQ